MNAETQSGETIGGAQGYILRPASNNDVAALAELSQASFCAAFEHLYSAENLATFLKQAYASEVVASEIADPAKTHQLAEGPEGLIGYCKMTQPGGFVEHSDALRPIALNQLYTAPGLTGRGVGAALMDWAIAEARLRNCDAIQLSVWAENHGAQRFYERYGFTKIADIDFWVGSHRDDELLLELRLN